MTNQLAVNAPSLDAAIPYYGRQPAPEEVIRIKAPVMAHYAGDDPGINQGIPAFEEALKKAGLNISFVYACETQFSTMTQIPNGNEQAVTPGTIHWFLKRNLNPDLSGLMLTATASAND
jgi:carboxymethylenebutenolidase